MSSSKLNTETQARLKRQLAALQAEPGFTALAMKAINQWGKEEYILQYAVFLALKEAYEAGTRGEPPQPPEPPKIAPSGVIQRTRTVRPAAPAQPQAPARTTRLIRRQR